MKKENEQGEVSVVSENENPKDQRSEPVSTDDEKERAIEVIKILLRVRDRARKDNVRKRAWPKGHPTGRHSTNFYT